jgi:hypothetical protein
LLALVNEVRWWRYEWTLAHVSEDDAAAIAEPAIVARPWEDQPEPAPTAEAVEKAKPEPDHFATPDELRAFFGGSLRYTPN